VDYDNDGNLDLFVSNLRGFDFNNLPDFGKGKLCQYKGIPVQCGPRGLPGDGDTSTITTAMAHSRCYEKAGVWTRMVITGWVSFCSDLTAMVWLIFMLPTTRRRISSTITTGMALLRRLDLRLGRQSTKTAVSRKYGVTVGDYDHDGKFDLFVTNFDDDYNSFTTTTVAVLLPMSLCGQSGCYESSLRWLGTKFLIMIMTVGSTFFVVNGHVYHNCQAIASAISFSRIIVTVLHRKG